MLTLLIEFSTACDDHRGAGDGDAWTKDETGTAPTDGGPPAGDGDDGTRTGTGHPARPPVSVEEGDGGTVLLSVGTERRELAAAEAVRLRAALGAAIADRQAFHNTVGERRPDGSYVVQRRRSETTGNSVVFEAFGALCRLAERLPATVSAETVGREREGITGSRRHLLVWHLAEHPAFDYQVDSRSPLRVRAGSRDGERTETDLPRPEGAGSGETTGDD